MDVVAEDPVEGLGRGLLLLGVVCCEARSLPLHDRRHTGPDGGDAIALAEAVAVRLGLSPDAPVGLNKVTLTR